MTSPEGQTSAHLELRRFLDHVPALGWSALPDGSLDYANQRFLDYTGLLSSDLFGSGWKSVVYGDDIQSLESWSGELRQSQEAGTTEVRLRRFDGSHRWFLVFANPHRDESGRIVGWYGTNIDIEDRKQAEETLRARELSWLQIVDNIPGLVATMRGTGEVEFLNRQTLEYFGKTDEELKDWALTDAVHPDDLPRIIQARIKSIEEGTIYDVEHRCRRADGAYRWFQVRGLPVRNAEGAITAWYLLLTDIDDRKRAEQALQQTQLYLNEGQRLAHMGCWTFNAAGFGYWSPELFQVHGLDPTGQPPTVEKYLNLVHPEDREFMRQGIQKMLTDHLGFDLTKRIVRPDGEIRHVRCVGVPMGEPANCQGFVGTAMDVTEQEQLIQKLRQSEQELRTITDAIRQSISVLAPDGTTLYVNQVALDRTGLTRNEVNEQGFFPGAFHTDDVKQIRAVRQEGLSRGDPFELEIRAREKDGQYRWQLIQYNPLKDESGKIIRWYATATDINDRKRAEEQLRSENVRLDQERVYLEEQIRSEMGFEQIIGNSSALKHVLELVETVAPSDSTVLLLGETGTGKELIARAVHERSRRKAKTFVKLNCAAIPTGLLESELFGHEKGAFTGAIIQKVGRMELADQGTLFLDEVGDIPVDIQPKLLRALQEKEFERLGSTHTRKVNMRLVAATNRNLEKMVADREFRSDLFYRLNVFPIRIPPLRDRKEDIPLLVAYFVQKFAKQMQKRIDSIPVATMKALAAWDWPGNIRELENFIERAVILTKGESLAAPLAELRKPTIDEPARESAPRGEDDIARIVKQTIASLKEKRPDDEHAKRQHEEIVRVLTECKGRVGGSDGAAARMGLSRTTLISRMKKLGINPYDYA